MNTDEKIRMARQLANWAWTRLKRDFPSPHAATWKRYRQWREKFRGSCRSPLWARAKKSDVDAAVEALTPAASSRSAHLSRNLRLAPASQIAMTRAQALEAIGARVRYGRQHVAEVEFSAEDAGRTDLDYLCQVCQTAVEAGATILNLPDTVGYAVPEEYGENVPQGFASFWPTSRGITLSAHCHDDLGLAVANSLAAVRAGVRQIECTVNGIGERAGNAALEEIAVALAVRKDSFGVTTNIKLDQLFQQAACSRKLPER